MSREITPDHILPAVDDIEKKCVEIKQLIERYAEDDSYRSFYQFYLIDELPAIIFWLNDFKKTALDEPFSLFHLKASAKNLLNFLCNLLFLTEKAENNVDLLSHMNLLIAELELVVNELNSAVIKEQDALRKNFKDKSLETWLSEAGFETLTNENIVREMKEKLGYSDTELSNIDAQLFSHGRLFLNGLLRSCQSSGVENAIEKLRPLADMLLTIEAASPSDAHIIWVGPPTANKSEFLAMRSLKESYHEQKINFWVLDKHVASYKKQIAEFGLSNIEVISIENYAQKMDYHFDDQSSLLDQINYFKELSERKAAEAEKEVLGSPERQFKMSDAIRDRVTIVDHVKSLITLFEGGFIVDVDLIFSTPADHKRTTLPDMIKWTFPYVDQLIADVWFFYCKPVLNWDGSQKKYPEDSLVDERSTVKNDRKFYLQGYNKEARRAYAWRDGLNQQSNQPPPKHYYNMLGSAVCEIAGGMSKETRRIEYKALMALNSYVAVEGEYLRFKTANNYFCETAAVYPLMLPNKLTIVKYYSGSYRPRTSVEIAHESIHLQLVGLTDKHLFEHTLSQRCRFTRLDVTYQFECTLKFYLCQNREHILLTFPQLTMLHASLIFNASIFSAILNAVPIAKLPALLSEEFSIPQKLFSPNQSDIAKLTLRSFAEKLNAGPEIDLLFTRIEFLLALKNEAGLSDELLQEARFDPALLELSTGAFDLHSLPDKYSRLALSFKTKVPLENILKLSIQDCSNFLKLITTDCATSPSSSKYSLFPSEKILLAIPAVISKNINTKGAVLALLRDLYTAYSSRSYATTEQKKAIDDVILKVENTINFLVNPTIFLTEELINEATMDLNNPVHQALSEIANAIRDDQISNEAKRDEILEFISTSSAHKGPRCIKIK